MLFIDFNQVVITKIHKFYAFNKKPLTTNDVVHITYSSILECVSKFKQHDVVIACDSKSYWRKNFYKLYKFHRKDLRDKSPLDWNLIHNCLNKIKRDIKENFRYKLIEVESAEADDIIGTLVPRISPIELCIICSADRDFIQLQQYNNVKQYDPKIGEFITSQDPLQDLKIKIIKGDRGDFIPSFLSNDDYFLSGKRQTRITEQKLQQWLIESPEVFCNADTLQNYYRNQTLIDFNYIPLDIKEKIINEYESLNFKGKNLFHFFMKNNLIEFLNCIGDF